MKQQDYAILIFIVIFAGIFSFFISNKFITPSNKQETAEQVSAITSEFVLPSNKIFNAQAINPTVTIQIAPNNNPDPFSGQQ